MMDKYGRKINYLRISITDRCNYRCRYCMPEDGVCKKEHQDILRFEDIIKVVSHGAAMGISKIRLTGGEPLIRKGVVDLVRQIKSIDGIKEVAMTTNGSLLPRFAKELKEAGLDRVNVSLDSLNADKFKDITRGADLKEVLDGIKLCQDLGMSPIKINVVLIGGFNDDEIVDFVSLTKDQDIDVRFIELMPIGEASQWSKGHFIPNTKVLEMVPELNEVEAQDISSPAKYYKLDGAKGTVGLINPISCTFCSNCNRIRLTSDGKLKPCLHSDDEIDLKDYIENNNLDQAIQASIETKPKEHHINDEEFKPIKRNMNQVGG
ncbi:MAG: GTP 3',8-cyclase MoaA [Firmicutes bacterium]|jgi:cyclic pyranopterin phosphate synthase|nr:GTP 3',8-cyclase MoaA [Bacillota bacterium]